MAKKWIYQRDGGSLVTWNRMRPPSQTKAADTQALGSLGDTDVFDRARRLPRGGAPEYINDGLGGVVSALAPDNAALKVVDLGASLAMAYHGYKRNNGSVLWGILWSLTGIGGVPFAVAQGFGKPKKGK